METIKQKPQLIDLPQCTFYNYTWFSFSKERILQLYDMIFLVTFLIFINTPRPSNVKKANIVHATFHDELCMHVHPQKPHQPSYSYQLLHHLIGCMLPHINNRNFHHMGTIIQKQLLRYDTIVIFFFFKCINFYRFYQFCYI